MHRSLRRVARIAPGILLGALVAGTLVPTGAASAASVDPLSEAVLSTAAQQNTDTDYTQYVDPFVSTQDDDGQDLPGAEAPNSLVKINPLTSPKTHSGYNYSASKIAGFTHTDLDGVGGSGAGGDLLVVPTYVNYTKRPTASSYLKTFSHSDETSTPGYYQVGLTATQGTDGSISNDPSGAKINAEATTDVHSGQDRFTFPTAGTVSLVFDLDNNFTGRTASSVDVEKLSDGRDSISGSFSASFNGYNYKLYYYAETTAAVASSKTWSDDGKLSTASTQNGVDTGAILNFNVAAGGQLGVKVALSSISTTQAATDLANEMGSRTFDQVHADTKAEWNKILGRVQVSASATSDPTGDLEKLFYTHLYNLFTVPINDTSTSGTFRGDDGVIYKADGYTHYDGWSMWDDFRKYEILAIAYPDVYRDVTQSIADMFSEYANSGKSSMSDLVYSVPTVRFERSAVVVADAVSKGVKIDGLDLAYAGLKKQVDAEYSSAQLQQGYIENHPGDTVMDAYDDWAMSEIATKLGKTADAKQYLTQATFWVNSFKPSGVWTDPFATGSAAATGGVLMSRDSNGNFASDNPEQFQADNLYQGTLWQYNWYSADDMGGMIQLLGGKSQADDALKYMFGEQAPDDGTRMLHSNANEIDLQAPYLFDMVGDAAETQKWTRAIYTGQTWNRYIATGQTDGDNPPSSNGEFTPPLKTQVFKLDPQGFLPTMDNDAGTMSSTFVAAGLGLFPVVAGSANYEIGSPFFDSVAIDYPNGKTFTIKADNVSPSNYYIQSATLNGKAFDQSFVNYQQMLAGGTLDFQMGDTASTWSNSGPQPDSLSDHVDSAIYDKTDPVHVSGKDFSESAANDGTISNTITVTADGAVLAGRNGDDLSSDLTVSGVPAGLSLTATRASNTQLTLKLSGAASAADQSDSIDDLAVAVKDAAFSTKPAAGNTAFDFKVAYTGSTITADTSRVDETADGAVDGTVTLSLDGGAGFAGSNGDDLIANGGLTLVGLPSGLTATAVKTSDTTLKLHVTGQLSAAATDSFTLDFADTALTGVTAAELTGDGLTDVDPLQIQVDPRWRDALASRYDDDQYVVQGNYSASTFAVFSAAVAQAKAALADTDAEDAVLEQADGTLTAAEDQLALNGGPYRVIQAEQQDEWSNGVLAGSQLKDESYQTASGDLGGVTPGAWAGYKGLDFTGSTPDNFTIHYVNNSTRSAADSYVELHVGSSTGPLITKISLPVSGSDWSSYTSVTHEFTAAEKKVLTDAEADASSNSSEIVLVFGGSLNVNPWLVNVDWFQFGKDDSGSTTPPPPTSYTPTYTMQAESGTLPDGTALTGSTTPKTETSTDSSSASLTDVGATADGQVLEYSNVDLGSDPVNQLAARYVNNSSRVGNNSHIDVFLDTTDTSGAPFTTVSLPVTGSNWNAYGVTTPVALPTSLTGTHSFTLVLHTTVPDSNHPFVSNLDWFQFTGPQVTTNAPPPATNLHVEAESGELANGTPLSPSTAPKTENSTDSTGAGLTDVGGTADGQVITYPNLDFGANRATALTVRYVNNSSRVGNNSHIDVFMDTSDTTGTPYASIPLPVTGNNWNAYGTTTVQLPSSLTGKHSFTLVLHTTVPDGNHPYVGNLDWYEFDYWADKNALQSAITAATPLVAEQSKYIPVDFRVFQDALSNAKSELADLPAGQSDVETATTQLGLATSQLQWKVVRQVAALLPQAQGIASTGWTTASFGALTDAITSATALDDSSSYTDYQSAYTGLQTAISGLKYQIVATLQSAIAQLPNPIAFEDISTVTTLNSQFSQLTDAQKAQFDDYDATAAKLAAAVAQVTQLETPPVITLGTLSVSYVAGTSVTESELLADLGATIDKGDLSVDLSGIDFATAGTYSGTVEGDFHGIEAADAPFTVAVTPKPVDSNPGGGSAPTQTSNPAPSDNRAAATVSAKVAGASYGKAAKVTITVKHGKTASTGAVTVTISGKTYTKALAKGVATITLPKTLTVGKHPTTVQYAGDAATKAGVSRLTVTVAKAPTKVTVKLSAKSAKVKKTKLTATVTTTVPGTSLHATGKVTIKLAGKKIKTITLKSTAKGKVSVKLPPIGTSGTKTITATFSPTASLAGSTGSAKVKVVR